MKLTKRQHARMKCMCGEERNSPEALIQLNQSLTQLMIKINIGKLSRNSEGYPISTISLGQCLQCKHQIYALITLVALGALREKEKVIQVKTVTKNCTNNPVFSCLLWRRKRNLLWTLKGTVIEVSQNTAGPLPKAIQNRILISIHVQEFKENNLMFSSRESHETHLRTNG
uniref:Uncharacterized protein n=1 Tax=Glossina pallidipes TaxID=7398 RepID=A0A1A9ZZA0_GLOPL